MAALLAPNDRLPPDRQIVLAPMAHADVERMIRHRLRQAGRPESGAIDEVAAQSNGVPLQVLGLCRRVLRDEEEPKAAAAGAAIAAAGTPVPKMSVPELPLPETPAGSAAPAAAAPRTEPAAAEPAVAAPAPAPATVPPTPGGRCRRAAGSVGSFARGISGPPSTAAEEKQRG
ncbi:MAG: hypothetical protein U1E33_07710 [Rhodospirillales bacterium]